MTSDTSQPSTQLCALVVDDDEAMRTLLAEVLLEHGHLAVTAGSAEEAAACLPLYTFHLAYLDHNLPGMEGFVFGEWLRKNNAFMQIALVTAQVDDELRTRCAELGLTFVAKPFDVRDVVELSTRYLEAAAARMEEDKEAPNPWHDPPFALFADDLAGFYAMPSASNRIEETLVRRIGDAMANLHSVSRYTERDRVAALSGLLTARVMGIRLPRGRAGKTLYEEYDDLMIDYGRRPEFSEAAEDRDD